MRVFRQNGRNAIAGCWGTCQDLSGLQFSPAEIQNCDARNAELRVLNHGATPAVDDNRSHG
jgi:hypothetical protein